MEVLAEKFLKIGLPGNLRSDNVLEFRAKVVRQWLEKFGVKNMFIEPGGSPGGHWENGYNESFNGKLRDEILNVGVFTSLKEAQSD